LYRALQCGVLDEGRRISGIPSLKRRLASYADCASERSTEPRNEAERRAWTGFSAFVIALDNPLAYAGKLHIVWLRLDFPRTRMSWGAHALLLRETP